MKLFHSNQTISICKTKGFDQWEVPLFWVMDMPSLPIIWNAPPSPPEFHLLYFFKTNFKKYPKFSSLWGNYLEGGCYWLLPWGPLISIDLQRRKFNFDHNENESMPLCIMVVVQYIIIIWMVLVVPVKVTLMVLRIVMCGLILGPHHSPNPP